MSEIFVSASLDFKYRLLSRMIQDCKYFLGCGNGCEKYLWGGTVEEHILSMKKLLYSIDEELRPVWLTAQQIDEYELLMKKKTSKVA